MEFAEIFANELTTAVYVYGSFIMMLVLAATATFLMPSRPRDVAASPVRA